MNIENNSDVSLNKFWDECYQNNDTGWDLGKPTPIFVDWCNNLNSSKKICVPGSGNGYDSLYFASKGHQVTAIDFSGEPIKRLKKYAKKNNLDITVLQKNIFDLNIELQNSFDYIVEYTCYCAIDPEMRNKYINVMYDLLKDKGEFIGIFFPLNKDISEGGPPFGVNLSETISQFLNKFKLVNSIEHPLSIKPRKGNEQFVRFIK